ncbi:hypothetical protein DFH11DRAFT_1883787 [Phellopilus nigrolimitatus]|nr:hypothetical protein DFH11DRAFT_1883787 [Phellopilus nigrolimitatus]
MTTSALRTHAALVHPKMSQIPIISEGSWTVQLFSDWKSACEDYRIAASVDDDEELIRRVARGLKGRAIRNWYTPQAAAIQALDFDAFTLLLRPIVLEYGWESRTKAEILALRQHGRKANEFYYEILEKNDALLGTTYVFDNRAIRDLMEAHCDDDVRRELEVPTVHGIVGFDNWLLAAFQADETTSGNCRAAGAQCGRGVLTARTGTSSPQHTTRSPPDMHAIPGQAASICVNPTPPPLTHDTPPDPASHDMTARLTALLAQKRSSRTVATLHLHTVPLSAVAMSAAGVHLLMAGSAGSGTSRCPRWMRSPAPAVRRARSGTG